MQNSNTSRIIENAWTIKDVTYESINSILASIFERLPYILAGLLVMAIYFRLDTNEAKPMEVFDRVATEIKASLSRAGVEMYPRIR